MEYTPYQPEVPEAEDVILSVYADFAGLARNEQRERCVHAATDWLHEQYRDRSITRALSTCAELVESTDDRYEAPHSEAYTAFYRGGLIGIRIADKIIGSELLDMLAQQKIAIPQENPSSDRAGQLRGAAYQLLDIGASGYESAGEYGLFLEEIADELCPDVATQAYLRRGFGLMMHQLDHALLEYQIEQYELDLEAFQADIELSDYDWNEKLAELLTDGADRD